MSETVIFAIGAVIFAITVYGSVMAGGLALTRLEAKENEAIGRSADLTTVTEPRRRPPTSTPEREAP